jgi:hypothetical protein
MAHKARQVTHKVVKMYNHRSECGMRNLAPRKRPPTYRPMSALEYIRAAAAREGLMDGRIEGVRIVGTPDGMHDKVTIGIYGCSTALGSPGYCIRIYRFNVQTWPTIYASWSHEKTWAEVRKAIAVPDRATGLRWTGSGWRDDEDDDDDLLG